MIATENMSTVEHTQRDTHLLLLALLPRLTGKVGKAPAVRYALCAAYTSCCKKILGQEITYVI